MSQLNLYIFQGTNFEDIIEYALKNLKTKAKNIEICKNDKHKI